MMLPILPLIFILACVLAWRTRGVDRVLSLAVVALTGSFALWYFGFLAA